AEAFRVDADRTDQVERARVIGATVGRYQPGNADQLALGHGLEGYCVAAGRGHFQGHPAVANHVELVRRGALVEEVLAGVEADVPRTARDELDHLLAQPGEEPVVADELVHSFDHGVASADAGCSRMARTSSVMSMPTGHQ